MTRTNTDRQIVYFYDRGFEGCTLVSLHSVLRQTAGKLKVFLHPTEVMEHSERDAEVFSRRFPNAEVVVQNVDLSPWQHVAPGPLPLTSRIRLLLPKLHTGKVLYIDGDTLARRDISPLVDFDMQGCCVAGTNRARNAIRLAIAHENSRRGRKAAEMLAKHSKALGGIDMTRYFNAGIMLFDLDRIVETGRDALMTDLEATARYSHRDQTFLNAIFNDSAAQFDPTWNSGWGEPRTGNLLVPREVRERFRNAREDPGLLHFKGKEKPWHAPKPPFKFHLLARPGQRRLRNRFWAEYQAETAATEALLSRRLFA